MKPLSNNRERIPIPRKARVTRVDPLQKYLVHETSVIIFEHSFLQKLIEILNNIINNSYFLFANERYLFDPALLKYT